MTVTIRTQLLALTLGVSSTAAFADSFPAAWRYNDDGYYAVRPMPPIYGRGYNYRFRHPPYGLGRTYRLDADTCRPGACRDNPYY
jgi:hypothetical protein